MCIFSEYRFLNDCSAAIKEEVCERSILMLQEKDRLQPCTGESFSFQHKSVGPTQPSVSHGLDSKILEGFSCFHSKEAKHFIVL